MRLHSRLSFAFAAALAFSLPLGLRAQARADEPFVVEYFYKIKWGYTAEWLELYKRNHYQ